MRPLRDSVVVITGASAGIGAALARELAPHGARLVLAARRLDRLEALARELKSNSLCVSTDVSHPDACASLIERAAAHFGRIDTLVCNAGFGLINPIHLTPAADVRRIIDTNILGTTECIRQAVPRMQAQEPRDGYRGQIMIVSSAAARRGLPCFGFYSMTKAAQLSIAEAARVELARHHIAVTSIHPMPTQTEFFEVANATGALKLPGKSSGPRQSAQAVARKMARAMERPCRELWPMPCSRLLLNLAVLIPALGDWVMAREYRAMRRHNSTLD